MNILLVTETFYPILRGGEIVLQRIGKELASRGHRVQVLTSMLDNTSDYEYIDGIEIFRPLSISFNSASRDIQSIFKKVIYQIQFTKALYQHIQKHKPEVIYNQAYTVTIPCLLSGKLKKLPVITGVGSYFGKEQFNIHNKHIAVLQYLKEVMLISILKHDCFRFPSKSIASNVSHTSKSKIAIINSPIDNIVIRNIIAHTDSQKIRNEFNINDNELFLTYVGALVKVKNIDQLIKSMASVNKPYKLFVVGEGPERKKLEGIVKSYNIKNNIIFLGSVDNIRVLEIMYSADCLLLSSLSETFALAAVEALSLNTPVIATRVGCLPDIQAKNLNLVESASDIGKVIQNGFERYEDWSIIDKFSVKTIGDQFEKMFNDVIAKR